MDNTNYKICDICGNLVDNNNIVNINDNEVCKSCIEKKLEQKQTFSPLATFMCSLIPGVAHIYLGKKQKGIFLLFSFISSIFLASFSFFLAFVFDMVFDVIFISIISDILVVVFLTLSILLGIVPFFIYIYSLADANISRKYIENNVYIENWVDKLAYKFFNKKNKKCLEDKIIDKRLQ